MEKLIKQILEWTDEDYEKEVALPKMSEVCTAK